jgi:hypothetical protein
MTSISGILPPSSSGSASQLNAAQGALGALLTSNGMLANLDSTVTSGKPTYQQVLSTLWTMFDPSGGSTITKASVQQAVAAVGGPTSTANAIWSQLSPFGVNSVSKTSFNTNSFLTSTVNANMSMIQKSFSTYTNSSAGMAENTMTTLITSNDVIQALSSQSSTYVPPSTNQMLSTLWALFDATGAKTISEASVKQGVLAEGGTASGAQAIWSQLAPGGGASINAAQFISSRFLTTAMTANTQKVQSVVSKVLLSNTGTSNSVLDKFSSGGADILNGAASGFGDSAVGSGRYTNNLNLFV